MADEPTTHKAEPKTVRLAVGFPVVEHHDDEYIFTKAGTNIPAGEAKAVIARAALIGVTLTEVEA